MTYKHTTSNEVKISYHERGSGEPLVLLMGFGADGTVWEKHVSVYEKHFRCIIPDNRGVGKSDQPPGPYTTLMMAKDTIAVMDHAGVKQAHVAGISMGGAIAQQIAINYPERVKKLMLICTWPRFSNYAKAVYENLKHIRASVSGEHFMELLQLWIFAPPYYQNHWNELKEDAIQAGKNPTPQTRNGFEGQLDACINHDTVEQLNRINAPVLITAGLKDIFTPPEFSELIHEKIPGSVYSTYPEGGHVHHWEDLERFNRETTEFLLK